MVREAAGPLYDLLDDPRGHSTLDLVVKFPNTALDLLTTYQIRLDRFSGL